MSRGGRCGGNAGRYGGGGYDCFVATACYGDTEITKSLREWRDQKLNGSNWFVKKFIAFYYSGVGKFGANILNKYPRFKPTAKNAIQIFCKMFRV